VFLFGSREEIAAVCAPWIAIAGIVPGRSQDSSRSKHDSHGDPPTG